MGAWRDPLLRSQSSSRPAPMALGMHSQRENSPNLPRLKVFFSRSLGEYKSSLRQFALTQIMRFAAIYRPFGDMRLRQAMPRCLNRVQRPEPRSSGSAEFGGLGAQIVAFR